MPKGGPRSNKPTALRILQGTARPDRVKPNEPRPRTYSEVPNCPAGLDVYGRAKWKQRAPVLVKLGLLTEADLDLLEVYCETYAQWKQSLKVLKTLSPIDDDYRKVAVTTEKARTDMRLISAEFGMSPSSRSRLSVVPEDEEKDPFEEWEQGASSSAG